MATKAGPYASDRWVTPGVIIAALLVGGGVVASIVGGVAYLSARGIDPDPLLKLAATLVGAVGSVGTFVLQLAQRATAAKVERNTGVLVGVVDELAAGAAAAPPPAQPYYMPAQPPADEAPWPPPAPPGPRYDPADVDDDLAETETETAQRVSVPPIPALPRHLRRRTDPPS